MQCLRTLVCESIFQLSASAIWWLPRLPVCNPQVIFSFNGYCTLTDRVADKTVYLINYDARRTGLKRIDSAAKTHF